MFRVCWKIYPRELWKHYFYQYYNNFWILCDRKLGSTCSGIKILDQNGPVWVVNEQYVNVTSQGQQNFSELIPQNNNFVWYLKERGQWLNLGNTKLCTINYDSSGEIDYVSKTSLIREHILQVHLLTLHGMLELKAKSVFFICLYGVLFSYFY